MIFATIQEKSSALIETVQEKGPRALAAAAPAGVGVSLAFVNSVLGAVSLSVGIAYQLWKWRRDARRAESQPPAEW